METFAGWLIVALFIALFRFSVAHGFTWLAVFTGACLALFVYACFRGNDA